MTTNCDRNTPFTEKTASMLEQARRIDTTKQSTESYAPFKKEAPSALSVQAGGDHYRTAKIQPVEFIHANNIPFCEANVIKYVFRWKTKNGVKDLEKARHYIDLLIELESKNV